MKRYKLTVEKHELYNSWNSMVRSYKSRGLICERWEKFDNFIEDIKIHPGKSMFKFARKDLSVPYSINNYRWKPSIVNSVEHREEYKMKMREYVKKRREINPDYDKHHSLKKQYNIGIEDYKIMLENQKGVCAICGEKEKSVAPTTKKIRQLNVDHCHSTGKIRGLLCSSCNNGLGRFNDSIKKLENAIEYLKINNINN